MTMHPLFYHCRKKDEYGKTDIPPSVVTIIDQRLSGLFQSHYRDVSTVDAAIIASLRSAYLQGFCDAHAATKTPAP